ncbi:hypothetical protein BN2476_940008 [Paraburkholderia piptadeniae]|uniref:Uncharacterized protein n=1 Tax=Paraburkholderia piptadeniae TaxID=1701573 RepID=A0A1N7STG8_9BURK|nr:hypothetical protein BN2476_940008 [Paraburkholderia piptadeniae]
MSQHDILPIMDLDGRDDKRLLDRLLFAALVVNAQEHIVKNAVS